MKARSPARQRCTECRAWFHPRPSARHTQKVCGAACRRRRDNALAQRRREEHLDAAREDERLRQKKCRTSRRAPGDASPSPPCHAPPSDDNLAKLQKKVLEEWDKEAALSRATLQRAMARILAGSTRFSGTTTPGSPPVSRASLDRQEPSIPEVFG